MRDSGNAPAAYQPGIEAGRLLLCAPFPEREERITAAPGVSPSGRSRTPRTPRSSPWARAIHPADIPAVHDELIAAEREIVGAQS